MMKWLTLSLLLTLVYVVAVQCGPVDPANGTFLAHRLILQTVRCSAATTGERVMSINLRRQGHSDTYVAKVSTLKDTAVVKDFADRLRCVAQGDANRGQLNLTCLQSPPFDMTKENLYCDYYLASRTTPKPEMVIVSRPQKVTMFECSLETEGEEPTQQSLQSNRAEAELVIDIHEEGSSSHQRRFSSRDVSGPELVLSSQATGERTSNKGGPTLLLRKTVTDKTLTLSVVVADRLVDTFTSATCSVQLGSRLRTVGGTLSNADTPPECPPPCSHSDAVLATSAWSHAATWGPPMAVGAAVGAVGAVLVGAVCWVSRLNRCKRSSNSSSSRDRESIDNNSKNETYQLNQKPGGGPLLEEE